MSRLPHCASVSGGKGFQGPVANSDHYHSPNKHSKPHRYALGGAGCQGTGDLLLPALASLDEFTGQQVIFQRATGSSPCLTMTVLPLLLFSLQNPLLVIQAAVTLVPIRTLPSAGRTEEPAGDCAEVGLNPEVVSLGRPLSF